MTEQRSQRVWQVCALLSFIGVSASSCSPNFLFGGGKDDSILNGRSYRKVNTACSGLDLSQPELDSPTFRKLLGCFNSNGGLQAIADLVAKLNDADLKPLVDLTNKHVLTNRRMIFDVESTYYALDKAGVIDETFTQLGKLLSNEAFIAAAINLLREGYDLGKTPPFPQEDALRRLLGLAARDLKPNRDLLIAIERFAAKVNPESVKLLLDLGLTFSQSQAFDALVERMKVPVGAEDLLRMTTAVMAFLSQVDARSPRLAERALKAVGDGDLFPAVDEIMGRTAPEVRIKLPRMVSVLDVMLRDQGAIFNGMTSLFHFLHRPIPCMKGAKEVPDGTMQVIRELVSPQVKDAADYIRRENILTLASLSPFCSFPTALGEHYGSMIALADTPAIEPTTETLRAFYRVVRNEPCSIGEPGCEIVGGLPLRKTQPLLELMVDALADTGEGELEDKAGIKLLRETLGELQKRDLFTPMLLLASQMREEERVELASLARFLLEPVQAMGGKNTLQVFVQVMSEASPIDLFNFVRSLTPFIDAKESMLKPAMAALRRAYYVNDVHPFVTLLHDLVGEASQQEVMFNTLFKVSEMPEFLKAIGSVSTMAQNGQLKELIASVITLYHKFAREAQHPVKSGAAPEFTPLWRFDLGLEELVAFPTPSDPGAAADRCRKIDLNAPLHLAGDAQMEHFLACQNSRGDRPDVVEAIRFLRSFRTESGKTFFDFQVGLIEQLGSRLTPEALAALTDRWLEAYKSKDFTKLLDALPFWTTRPYRGADEPGSGGPVLEPLLKVAGPILDRGRDALRRLEAFGATVLRREDFKSTLAYAHDLWDVHPEPAVRAYPEPRLNPGVLERWVRYRECWHPGPPELRAAEIRQEYTQAVTTWDLVNGKQRRRWDLEGKGEFREMLEPLLKKLGNPSEGVPGKSPLQALMNTIGYFSLKPGEAKRVGAHYTPTQFRDWLWSIAHDPQIINYYFPGEKTPRLRLVNTLDLLELVLLDADFVAPWPISENMGMKFLGVIAEAWGDEKQELWPKEIHQRYLETGKWPPTLAEAARELEGTAQFFASLLGYPKPPKCDRDPTGLVPPDDKKIGVGGWVPGLSNFKYNLYNIHQSLPVIEAGIQRNGGMTMRVLRNLFFEFLYSSPAKFRNAKSGWNNNLSVVMRLVRLGITHQTGRQMWLFEQGDPALGDFFETFVRGAKAPEVISFFETVLAEGEKSPLVWAVLSKLFEITDAAEGRLTPARQKELDARPTHAEREALLEEWKWEHRRMRQLALYSLAAVTELERRSGDLAKPQSPFVRALLRTLSAGLGQYKELFTKNADNIDLLLREKRLSWFFRAVQEDERSPDKKVALLDLLNSAVANQGSQCNPTHLVCQALSLFAIVDADPVAKPAWELFKGRFDVMKTEPAYEALDLGSVLAGVLRFMEGRPATPPFLGEGEAAEKVRLYFADRLDRGDLEQFLYLAKQDPEHAFELLQTVGKYIEGGQLPDYFAYIYRSLPAPRASRQ